MDSPASASWLMLTACRNWSFIGRESESIESSTYIWLPEICVKWFSKPENENYLQKWALKTVYNPENEKMQSFILKNIFCCDMISVAGKDKQNESIHTALEIITEK